MQFNVEYKRSLNVRSTTCSSLFMKNSSFIIYEKKGLILVSSPLYNIPRGPWTTSLTWEIKHLSKVMIIYISWNGPSSFEEDFKIFPLSLLSPLGNEHCPSFEQTWISFIQGCFVPSLWLKLAQWVWRRRKKCEKFTTTTTTKPTTTTTTTTTDNEQIVIRKAHLSLWLRWAKTCTPPKLTCLNQIISFWKTES